MREEERKENKGEEKEKEEKWPITAGRVVHPDDYLRPPRF